MQCWPSRPAGGQPSLPARRPSVCEHAVLRGLASRASQTRPSRAHCRGGRSRKEEQQSQRRIGKGRPNWTAATTTSTTSTTTTTTTTVRRLPRRLRVPSPFRFVAPAHPDATTSAPSPLPPPTPRPPCPTDTLRDLRAPYSCRPKSA